uniref:Restriction endonuclease type IV Mrr domain-containing protein n=1 Tax=Aplanochytrium stocchinoi TaxID=215587 RepID=A0A7S3LID6_9STRA|mmetsp:Transcript_19468/g.23676  ORF Transcript_19468/g.23676 Transcript_19468/m.23676 type:complete len:234 (+) Transcript_19468:283-984(+)
MLRSFGLAKASQKLCVSWKSKANFGQEYRYNCNHIGYFGNISVKNKSSTTSSYVQEGYAFEKTTRDVLLKHGFILNHRGGPNDAGLDFEGFWRVKHNEIKNIPVALQCKKKKKRVGVAHIRELEGSLVDYCKARSPTHSTSEGWDVIHVLGVFVSSSGFTLQSQRQCLNSALPLMLVDLNGDRVEDILLSRKAKVLIPNLIVTKQRTLDKKNVVFILYDDDVIMSFEPKSHSE